MKIISKVVSIKDVAKVRDKLVNSFLKDKEKMDDYSLNCTNEELQEMIYDYIIDEINDAFDFDGEEEVGV